MNPNDPNVQLLDIVADRLGDDLCGRLVFVGGALAGLLITDPAQPAIRPTEDVDLIAQVIASAWMIPASTVPTRGSPSSASRQRV